MNAQKKEILKRAIKENVELSDILQRTNNILKNMVAEELKKENQNKKDDDDLTDAERLEARASAICGKDYSPVFKASDNSGIYKCNDYTNAIYSIANSDRSESEYQHLAHATYLGTNDDETVNQFFKDKLYIYQDYRYSGVPHQLILLFESLSEKALVENILM